MDGAVSEMAEAVSPQFATELADSFSVRLNFFGEPLAAGWAAAILAGTVLLFGVCFVVSSVIRAKRIK